MCFAIMHDAQLSSSMPAGLSEPPARVHSATSGATSKLSSASSTPAKRNSSGDYDSPANKKQKLFVQTIDLTSDGEEQSKVDNEDTDPEITYKSLNTFSEIEITSSTSSTPSKRKSPSILDSPSNKKQKLSGQASGPKSPSIVDKTNDTKPFDAQMAGVVDDGGSTTSSSLRSTPAASIKSTDTQAPLPSGTKQASPSNDARSQSTGLEKVQGPISAEDARYLLDKVYRLNQEHEELKSSANTTRSRLEKELKELKSDADATLSLKELVAGMVSQDQTEFLINQIRRLERTARDQKAQLDGSNSHTATQMKYKIYELETSERRAKEKMVRDIRTAKDEAQEAIQKAKEEAEVGRKERSERWKKSWLELKAKIENSCTSKIEKLEAKHEMKYANRQKKYDEAVEGIEEKWQAQVDTLEARINNLKTKATDKDTTHKEAIAAIRAEGQRRLEDMRGRHTAQERLLKDKHAEAKETMLDNHHEKLEQMKKEYKKKIDAKAPKLKEEIEAGTKLVEKMRKSKTKLEETNESLRKMVNSQLKTISDTSEKLATYDKLLQERNLYESQVKTLKSEAQAKLDEVEKAEDEMSDVREHEGHLFAIMKKNSESNQVRFNVVQRAKFDAQQSVVVKDRLIAGLRAERDAAVKLCKEQETEIKRLHDDLEKGTTMRPVMVSIRSPQEHDAYVSLLTTEHEKTERVLEDRDAQVVRLQAGLAGAIKDVEKSEQDVKEVNRELDLNNRATAVWSNYDPERTFSDAEVSPTESAFSIGYDGVEDVAADSIQAQREMEDIVALQRDVDAVGAEFSSSPRDEGSMVDANIPASAYARGMYHE